MMDLTLAADWLRLVVIIGIFGAVVCFALIFVLCIHNARMSNADRRRKEQIKAIKELKGWPFEEDSSGQL